jgi:hypothetical protein
MKAIHSRLQCLEQATAPAERERAAVEAILNARRCRLGANYEPVGFPPESYADCQSTGDDILRARQLRIANEHKRTLNA